MLTSIDLKRAVQDAYYQFYSKPYTVINIKALPIPIAPELIYLKSQAGNEYYIRSSHGLLHVTGAMELIDNIDELYQRYLGERYKAVITAITEKFNIKREELLKLVKIAALLHDAGRKGDGQDLWDEKSANLCLNYLKKQLGVENEELADFIADLIRFKDIDDDKPNPFKAKYHKISEDIDIFRELVNMADTMEVMRTRDTFDPKYMPIYKYGHVNDNTMREEIIPNFIVPYRRQIVAEGRLSKKGRIKFEGYQDDEEIKSGKDFAVMAEAFEEVANHYGLSLLEINNENDLDQAIERTLRGINTYLDKYKNQHVTFFHNGFFSPRFHGEKGQNRALYFKDRFESGTKEQKYETLYALFHSKDGTTLKEEILRSFNQYNHKKLYDSIGTTIQPLPNVKADEESLLNIIKESNQYKPTQSPSLQ
ncbi:MAG: SidE phosphodiesterase domain-containing protein [Proteobacteria bacterium]|nr:SidE phosphodiesterase domain-containing protein [Pseudomonadota bacterium]